MIIHIIYMDIYQLYIPLLPASNYSPHNTPGGVVNKKRK